ncbi:MAG: glycosyltransferase family 9 protein [Bacteroidia bacterium]|nr:glycosyltransferase family 9 protein [Bacteroidia bacterium]MDW8345795.1 glycosyltransferase family 9 protein [Bacteroidia bacterium]
MNEIIISRVDSIGDVVLTLPMCGIIKKHFPEVKITFLGQSYTQPVILTCEYVDNFVDVKNLTNYTPTAEVIIHVFPRKDVVRWAYQKKTPVRICTYSRLYAWLYANKLVRLHRKNSTLHEAQLNLKLLKPLGISTDYSLSELCSYYGMTKIPPLPNDIHTLLSSDKENWVIHPTSQGSAREWGLSKYKELIHQLDPKRYNVFITGTERDKSYLTEWLKTLPGFVHDLTGKLSLQDLIAFIYHIDGLVAGSTGPLHIAAALGKKAIGIYPSIRPMHPGRWQPIGKQAEYIYIEKNCSLCKKTPSHCACLQSITPEMVVSKMKNIK